MADETEVLEGVKRLAEVRLARMQLTVEESRRVVLQGVD